MTSVNEVTYALAINSVIALVLLAVFEICSHRYELVYSWRLRAKNPPPRKGGYPFAWVVAALGVPDSDIASGCGLDAVMYLRFVTLMIRIFAAGVVLLGPILVPLNLGGANNQGNFEALSLSNVRAGSPRLWGHLFAIYLFSAITMYLVHREFASYIELRHDWMRRADVSSRAVMVNDVPAEYQSSEGVTAYFKKLFPSTFHSAVLISQSEKLRTAVREAVAARDDLERALVRYQATGERPRTQSLATVLCLSSSGEDAIEDAKGRLAKASARVKKLSRDTLRPSATGFVVFSRRADAHAASQLVLHADRLYWRVTMAPPRTGVLWYNVGRKVERRTSAALAAYALLAVVTVFFTAVVAAISALASLDAIAKALPFLHIRGLGEGTMAVLQGYIPTLVLTSLMILLPLFMRYLSTMQGHMSLTMVEEAVLNKMFTFQLFNVVFVTAAAGSVMAVLDKVVKNPGALVDLLGTSLPNTSSFFFNYVLLQATTTVPLELARVTSLFKAWMRLGIAVTAEQQRAAVDPGDVWGGYGLGPLYADNLLIFAVGSVYAVIAPMVLLPCLLFSLVTYGVYRHNFAYVYNVEADLGGRLFPAAINRMLVGLAVGQITMVGLLGFKGSPVQSALAVPLPLITAFFYAFLYERYFAAAYFLPRDADGEEGEEAASPAAVAPAEAAPSTAEALPRAEDVYVPPHMVAAGEEFAVHQDEVEKAVELARRRNQGRVSVLQLLQRYDGVALPGPEGERASAELPPTPRGGDGGRPREGSVEGDAARPLLEGDE